MCIQIHNLGIVLTCDLLVFGDLNVNGYDIKDKTKY